MTVEGWKRQLTHSSGHSLRDVRHRSTVLGRGLEPLLTGRHGRAVSPLEQPIREPLTC